MSRRTEPMHYEIEIEEIKTKKKTKAEVACWWSGDASANGWRAMCDCQLAGYFNAKPSKTSEGVSWYNSFTIAQAQYRQSRECDSQPSRKFRAVRAHLPSGDVIDLAA
jgi:hypothetical protein